MSDPEVPGATAPAHLPRGRTTASAPGERAAGPVVGMVWAQSPAGVIGAGGGLPWRLPEDLAHFRALTDGHPVVMGRRTWESLPARFRPLPGRRNLVLSRDPDFVADGAEVVGSLPAALTLGAGAGTGEVWLAGGAAVYAEGRRFATLAEVTEVDVEVPGDTYAPVLEGWTLTDTGSWQISRTGVRFRHLRYTR